MEVIILLTIYLIYMYFKQNRRCKFKCFKIVLIKTDPIKTIARNFNKKMVTCKIENFYILLNFLLITISLLIIVSIYCCFIKLQNKDIYYHITTPVTG